METRAPYALVGLLVVAAIAAVFGFVYWLNNTGALNKRTNYEIHFENSVSGLLKGAAVLFNGIRVGEVMDLRLSPDNPRKVTVMVAVAAGTPIRADTYVGLEFQGLTGVPVITLEGRSNMPPPAPSEAPPVLRADPAAGVSMTQAARDALSRLQTLLTENSEPLHTTLTNLSTFSGALARNSDRLEGIITAVERLTGSGPAPAPPVVYDLTAPRDYPDIGRTPSGQISVPEPTAVLLLDTQKILVWPSGAEGTTFSNARWSDNIPKLLQARIIQSFENANLLRSVVRPMDGLAASHQLLIDLRSFQLSLSPAPRAEVEFSAKILGGDGKIVDGRVFRATVPALTTDALGAAAALDEAFRKTAVELVVWTAAII
ncbi:MAG TPA: ABC-type transport auxiliary lipoprotein family protein [Xanthobacteraceae bacterium]|nr:ABC-type transport auxiliary lipoprotein family protein [Xanthobacteraceae bacterium]